MKEKVGDEKLIIIRVIIIIMHMFV